MKPFGWSRTTLLATAFAVGAGSLLAAAPTLAAQALFRVERKFFHSALPPATTENGGSRGGATDVDYGGAGRYVVYIEPYTSTAPPGTATVKAGNFVGSPFTLPAYSIVDYDGVPYTQTAKTGFAGYTTIATAVYHNGTARFGPGHGAGTPNGAPASTRVFFPTTGGNSSPNPAKTKNINYGSGNPITATTTFNGRYDVSKGGSIDVIAGTNRFGGTMRFLYGPEEKNYGTGWYQFIFKYSPTSIFKAYGTTRCQKAGIDCTSDPSGPFGHSLIGDITTTGMVTRYLLNQQFTTGTGMRLVNSTAKAKATTPATPSGTVPTVNGQGTPVSSLPASYRVARNYYIQQIHPWTTGSARAYNYFETPVQVNPRYAGYDTSLGDTTINVTRIFTGVTFNTTLNEVTYSTTTLIQELTGVKRVVSMVRPRIVNNYERPVDENDPIFTNFSSARLWTMKVFFVPEPAGLAMMGAGIAALLGLSLMRRR